MTREEILAMQPGRELDMLVAEAVFGFRWYSRPYAIEPDWRYEVFTGAPLSVDVPLGDPRLVGTEHKEEGRCTRDVGNYSTSIADDWLVVEHMRSEHYVSIQYPFGPSWNGAAYVVIVNNAEGVSESVTADTAPEAICKAALLTILGCN